MWNVLSRERHRDRIEIGARGNTCQVCGKTFPDWSDLELYAMISRDTAERHHIEDYNMFKVVICKECLKPFMANKCKRMQRRDYSTCDEAKHDTKRFATERSEPRKKEITHDKPTDPKKRFEELEV